MGKTSCIYNPLWATNKFPEFQGWIQAGNLRTEAYCKLCRKMFDVAAMGVSALKRHMESKIHKERILAMKMTGGISRFSSSSSSAPLEVVENRVVSSSQDLPTANVSASEGSNTDNSSVNHQQHERLSSSQSQQSLLPASSVVVPYYVINENVTRAELTWSLFFVKHHQSYRSADDFVATCRRAFPDSAVASNMKLGHTKLAYNIAFALAPFFKKEIVDVLSKCDVFVICFDEAFNRVSSSCQLDLWVRFYNESTNLVETRFLNSAFLGHSTATEILANFKKGLDGLAMSKILQISHDGPNVNWSFIKEFSKVVQPNASDPGILQIGSCGIHVVHNAFRSGHSAMKWDLDDIFNAMYYLFKESPAWRSDFTEITGNTNFAKKFCGHRWLENADVTKRALELLPAFRQYIGNVPRKPTIKSFETLEARLSDQFLEAKIKFFISVAAMTAPFLHSFQTAVPMAFFLYEDLFALLVSLLHRFIVPSVIETLATPADILNLDVTCSSNNSNLLPVLQTDVGLSTKVALPKGKKISELSLRCFYDSCRMFLSATVKKICKRSPLRYELTSAISCLSPLVIAATTTAICKQHFDTCLMHLMKANRIDDTVVDAARYEYQALIVNASVKEQCAGFRRATGRIDTFWNNMLGDNVDFKHLWPVVRTFLVLSHGNATVESGFSINEATLVNGMKELSIVAQRTVHDKILSCGGIEHVDISKELIRFSKGARARCAEYEEEQRKSDDVRRKANEERTQKKEELLQLQKRQTQLDNEKKRIAAEAGLVASQIAAKKRAL